MKCDRVPTVQVDTRVIRPEGMPPELQGLAPGLLQSLTGLPTGCCGVRFRESMKKV